MGAEFYKKYGFSKYSQHGEDGVIQECVNRINPVKISYEFGASNGIKYSNTYSLMLKGWHSVFIEGNEKYTELLLENIKGFNAVAIIDKVTVQNVNDLLSADIGVLSIDVDNDDYHIWAAYKGKADIVIIEINSGIIPPKEEIPGGSGASYTSMLKLGIKKGYFLIAHTGNMIFVLNKHRYLFPEIKGNGSNWVEYWDKDLK